MRVAEWRWGLKVLGRCLRLRCPNCGLGSVFAHGLHPHATCPYCWVRYERAPGESVGMAYITMALAVGLTYGGYFALEALFDSVPTLALAALIGGVVLAIALSFRTARALWIGVAYLTGGVYVDQDYEREYTRPRTKDVHSERQ